MHRSWPRPGLRDRRRALLADSWSVARALLRRRFELDSDGGVLPDAKEPRLEAGAVAATPSGGAVQLVNALGECPSIAIQVFGGDIGKVARKSRTPDGAAHFGPTGYANAPDAPPFDIWTIQTRIED